MTPLQKLRKKYQDVLESSKRNPLYDLVKDDPFMRSNVLTAEQFIRDIDFLLEAEKQMVITAFDEGASRIIPIEGEQYYNEIK